MGQLILKIYQGLGDYFTGISKRRFFYIVIIIIFTFLILISLIKELVVPVDTLYWVFSSLVQALLALVALMGVVSIFKLQSLKSSEDQLLMIAREQTYTYYIGAPPPTIELLMEKIEPIIKSNNLTESHHVYALRENVNSIKLSKDLVVSYATEYTVYTFFVVLLSLLFLMFVPSVSSFYAGVPALYLMFILTAYSLFLTTKGFSNAIR